MYNSFKKGYLMKYFIASDHAGIDAKTFVVTYLTQHNIEVIDLGPNSKDRVDYPDYAHKVCEHVLSDNSCFGILICGSGIGMSIAANKHQGIRAALCQEAYTASMARAHNNANILCFGARIVGEGMIENILNAWLNSNFEGGRHQERLAKLECSYGCI